MRTLLATLAIGLSTTLFASGAQAGWFDFYFPCGGCAEKSGKGDALHLQVLLSPGSLDAALGLQRPPTTIPRPTTPSSSADIGRATGDK